MAQFAVTERTVARYTGQIVDEALQGTGTDILEALSLTLVDDRTGQIINGRNNQNVLNTNDVAVDFAGNLYWTIGSLDNVIIGSGEYESHTAIFKWTWAGGTKFGYHEVVLIVRNLKRV
jgi:hypothetical protein